MVPRTNLLGDHHHITTGSEKKSTMKPIVQSSLGQSSFLLSLTKDVTTLGISLLKMHNHHSRQSNVSILLNLTNSDNQTLVHTSTCKLSSRQDEGLCMLIMQTTTVYGNRLKNSSQHWTSHKKHHATHKMDTLQQKTICNSWKYWNVWLTKNNKRSRVLQISSFCTSFTPM